VGEKREKKKNFFYSKRRGGKKGKKGKFSRRFMQKELGGEKEEEGEGRSPSREKREGPYSSRREKGAGKEERGLPLNEPKGILSF